MAARHKQIRERAGHEQAVGVLCEPAIAHLGKAEHPLDDPDRMFDPGAYLGLGAIFRSFGLIHYTAVAAAAIGEVLGSRCVARMTARCRDTLGRPTRGFRCRAGGDKMPAHRPDNLAIAATSACRRLTRLRITPVRLRAACTKTESGQFATESGRWQSPKL